MVRPASEGMPRDSMVLFCSAVSAIRAIIAKISARVVVSVIVSCIDKVKYDVVLGNKKKLPRKGDMMGNERKKNQRVRHNIPKKQ